MKDLRKSVDAAIDNLHNMSEEKVAKVVAEARALCIQNLRDQAATISTLNGAMDKVFGKLKDNPSPKLEKYADELTDITNKVAEIFTNYADFLEKLPAFGQFELFFLGIARIMMMGPEALEDFSNEIAARLAARVLTPEGDTLGDSLAKKYNITNSRIMTRVKELQTQMGRGKAPQPSFEAHLNATLGSKFPKGH